jgi:hypothetical protein
MGLQLFRPMLSVLNLPSSTRDFPTLEGHGSHCVALCAITTSSVSLNGRIDKAISYPVIHTFNLIESPLSFSSLETVLSLQHKISVFP